ncbi:energy-coupling factor ABC transporter permease [Methanosphaera sp. ISO3-F5]|uniref:energy-coupling factor ABC transporter permease n=1 Tax=Methanosphaera sp. ISO3-F5 TaxID=1452353 RepID=UPI002B262097|nr:energy-coupling factor ABC transporter permease [Methanosphaera sp. ISO3-F5]WQH63230.1 energy-coupling factor ABC transporter permease [Methanosphaera sp. ISO3-F5]
MHIMEGYLPPMWCAIWFIISAIVVIYGIMQIKKATAENDDALPLLALSGAFMFILSSLKMPSVSGSCSHPCGNGLGTVFFGPAVTAVLSVIVLLFQAILLAHGGLTTLGANIFSMGIVGPVCGYVVWVALRKMNLSAPISIFFTAFVADLMTYVATSVELALAFPGANMGSTFVAFLGIFALTQIPLAIAEGLLTMVIYNYIQDARPDILVKLGVISEQEAGAN